MNTNTARVLLVAGALLLFVLLFIAPKTAPANPDPAKIASEESATSNATIEVYATMAAKTLDPRVKQRHDSLSRTKSFDSLVSFWDKQRRPDLAAWYLEQKAGSNPAELFTAGNRYYYAVQFCRDNSEIPALYQSAIRCFRKGLQKEPDNTDARIMLASCYVEGSADPMKGITMLREIEKKDSNNVKLQLSFAAFSMKSGQTDKAIERFRKVLRIDSTYTEAYLHLADAYEQQGNKEATVQVLKEFARRTPDVTARLEVNKYINQLENK